MLSTNRPFDTEGLQPARRSSKIDVTVWFRLCYDEWKQTDDLISVLGDSLSSESTFIHETFVATFAKNVPVTFINAIAIITHSLLHSRLNDSLSILFATSSGVPLNSLFRCAF